MIGLFLLFYWLDLVYTLRIISVTQMKREPNQLRKQAMPHVFLQLKKLFLQLFGVFSWTESDSLSLEHFED